MTNAHRTQLIFVAGLFVLGLTGCEQPKGLLINGFEPKTGPYMGGDPVVFSGHGFTQDGPVGATVWFGGREGRNVRFRGDTELVVDTPGGEIGEAVDIIIKFDDGRSKKFDKAYTYVDPQAGFGVGELTDKSKEAN
jgi:hypothetical protein